MNDLIVLRVALFGALSVGLAVRPSEAPRPVLLTGRPGGLLALLALAGGRFFSRTELARELTSGSTYADGDGASAGSFNTLLWRLRKSLEAAPLKRGDVIETDALGAIRIASRVQIDTDVQEYRRLVEGPVAKPVEALHSHDIEQLKQAVSMYRGEVLASFQDDWALRLRERHRRLQQAALARLMHVSSLAQQWPDAIRYGLAMLELDELREDVHRELMRCYLQAGQRALALRQFERCRAALKRELAIQPMRETLALYHQIADAATHTHSEPEQVLQETPMPQVVPDSYPVQCDARVGNCIAQARWHLAQADAQLQMQLQLPLNFY